jgi:hypothetical protein
MALDQHALDTLCATGFGPLTLQASGGTWTATFAGRTATVAARGDAVAVAATRAVQWPEGATSPEEVQFRVAVALRTIELDRPELCVIEPSAAHDAVVVTIWLDEATAAAVDLARAVRSATSLGDVAALAIDRLRAAIAREADDRAAAERAAAAVEAARAALIARAAGTADGGAAAPPSASPTTAAPAALTTAAPTTATAAPAAPTTVPAAAAPATTPPAAAPAFTATHRVPAGGMPAWERPDPKLAVTATIAGGLLVQRLEQRRDGWAHVVCDNQWSAWVDGRKLEALH